MNLPKPVLIVEDSPRDTELAIDALDAHRLLNEVVAVGDGADALDFLYRRNQFANRPDDLPAMVLLDLKMPRVGGLEVLRQIRDDPKLNALPVIIMTASRSEKKSIASHALGVTGYLVKPVEFHAFVDAVKSLGGAWEFVDNPPCSCAHLQQVAV